MASNNKICGICKVGEKGQVVIPKSIRDMFNILPGDSLVVLADKDRGIAIIKADVFDNLTDLTLEGIKNGN